MDEPERFVPMGRLVAVHGLRGELKLESWSEPRTRIFRYRPWRLQHGGSTIQLDDVRGRGQGKGLVVALPGVDDRDAAQALVGAEVQVARSALPEPAPGEYYWCDLEGLEVVTCAGVALGTVSHLLATGANDVLVVRDGSRERLIPFLPGSFVTAVELARQRITVDWDPEF